MTVKYRYNAAPMSFEEFSKLVAYDRETGILTRLDLGRPTGNPNGEGYLQMMVHGHPMFCHRAAWQNRKRSQTNSKTGVLGVSPSYGRFRAAIEVDGKFKHIGRFDTVEEARVAHLRAKRRHHAGCTL